MLMLARPAQRDHRERVRRGPVQRFLAPDAQFDELVDLVSGVVRQPTSHDSPRVRLGLQ